MLAADLVSSQSIFPTPVWRFRLQEAESLNERLSAQIDELRAEYTGDIDKCREDTPFGTFQTRGHLHTRPEFAGVADLFLKSAQFAFAQMGHQQELLISGLWALLNGPGASTYRHSHENSILSGVYYVSAPEGSGRLAFFDPRRAGDAIGVQVAQPTEFNQRRRAFEPTAGDLLLFPSWLEHEVEPSTFEHGHDRRCLSFNTVPSAREQFDLLLAAAKGGSNVIIAPGDLWRVAEGNT